VRCGEGLTALIAEYAEADNAGEFDIIASNYALNKATSAENQNLYISTQLILVCYDVILLWNY